MEGTAVKKMGTKEKTLQQKGTKSEENMFRPFMEIFFYITHNLPLHFSPIRRHIQDNDTATDIERITGKISPVKSKTRQTVHVRSSEKNAFRNRPADRPKCL
jgi:hypothetical protein